MAEEKLLIEGTVQTVVYQSGEDGYTVLRMDSREEGTVTVVGCMPGVMPGETLSVRGSWSRHPTFGSQFKAEAVERRLPTGVKAIYEYLASGAVKGIGMATARRIVDAFGEDTLTVLEETPEKLAELRGITPRRAAEIGQTFLRQTGMRRLMEFLTQHELPTALGMSLWKMYGERAELLVKADPYLLLSGEFGVDFGQVDRLAASLGIEAEAPMRVQAGIQFELTHNLDNGHTFLPREKLLAASAQLLGLEGAVLEEGLSALTARGEVVEEKVAGQNACYLAELHEAEQYVAQRLLEMCGRELRPPEGISQLISSVEREQGITYAPQQRQAVELAARSQVMLLTGGPGTGKTTSLRGILGLFETLGLDTALAAPTGRAAKRLGELCGVEASTIHRLLEAGYDRDAGRLVFSRDEEDPLPADAVIVDETSMVDIPLMAALLAALKSECRLILVGDPDQLPSVGPGNLFSHLIRSGRIPMVRLTEIFRQAQQSAIVMSAHGVNRGELPPLTNGAASDFFFLRRLDGERAVETIVELCKTRLPQNMGIPSDKIQVLSPTRKYTTGTRNLNQALQAALNPPSEDKGERRRGNVVFREGDRVMQVKNNYDVMWRERSGLHGGMGVFNGDIGVIDSIDPRGEIVTVSFEDRLVEYTPDMLGELELAYAVTVHKSQGSEYRAVILAALDGAPMLLTRGVLYTAITRARELFIAVGSEEVLARMTANDRQTRRYSGLRARLAEGE